MSKPIDYAALTHKGCTNCKRRLPVAAFNRYNDPKAKLTGWRYYSHCRECNKAACRRYGAENKPHRNARLRRWRRANPEKAKQRDRRARLKAHYGLTEADITRMREVQDGKCLLCQRHEDECSRLVVDHCHATGRVRGLLCDRCNSWLGWLETNQDMIARTEIYLGETCHADILLELANR